VQALSGIKCLANKFNFKRSSFPSLDATCSIKPWSILEYSKHPCSSSVHCPSYKLGLGSGCIGRMTIQDSHNIKHLYAEGHGCLIYSKTVRLQRMQCTASKVANKKQQVCRKVEGQGVGGGGPNILPPGDAEDSVFTGATCYTTLLRQALAECWVRVSRPVQPYNF